MQASNRRQRIFTGYALRLPEGLSVCCYTREDAEAVAESCRHAGYESLVEECPHALCRRVGGWRVDTRAPYDTMVAALHRLED